MSTEEDVRRALAESGSGTVDPEETNGWPGDENADPGIRGWTA